MGFALGGRNLAFIEDLGINEADVKTPEQLQKAIEDASALSAHNCWVAVGLYAATLVVSVHQFWLNNRGITSRYHRQLWSWSTRKNTTTCLFKTPFIRQLPKYQVINNCHDAKRKGYDPLRTECQLTCSCSANLCFQKIRSLSCKTLPNPPIWNQSNAHKS